MPTRARGRAGAPRGEDTPAAAAPRPGDTAAPPDCAAPESNNPTMKGNVRVARGRFGSAKPKKNKDKIRIEKMTTEMKTLKEELERVKQERGMFEEETIDLREENEELKEKINEMKERAKTTARNREMKRRDFKKQLKKKDEVTTGVKRKLRQIEKQNTDTQKHTVELEQRVEEGEERVVELQQRVEDEEALVVELQQRVEEEGRVEVTTSARKIGTARGVEGSRNVGRDTLTWAAPLLETLEMRFKPDAGAAKHAALLYCLEDLRKKHPFLESREKSCHRYRKAIERLRPDLTPAAALKDMLASLETGSVINALPDDVELAIVRDAEENVLADVQGAWDATTCLNMQQGNFQSRRKWNRGRLLLSSHHVDGSWERKIVGKARFPIPMLPEFRQVVKVKTEINRKFKMARDGDKTGTSAHASLPTCLEADVQYAIRLGKLVCKEDGQVMCPNGAPLRVQFKMDAYRVWSKVQQTCIAYVFVNACTNANSPFDTTEFCLFEGDDHWDAVQTQAPETLGEINELIRTASLRCNANGDCAIEVDVWGGGDLSNQNDMLCVSSCNGPFPCPQCEQPREKMCKKGNATLRTLPRIDLLSHTTCGVCPGCGMTIVATQEEVKDPEKQMLRAEPGDSEPKLKGAWGKAMKAKKLTWLLAHFGIKYGHFPLLRIPVKRWPLCLLHMNLRIVTGMINRCVFDFLGDYGDAEEQAAALLAILGGSNVWMRAGALKPTSKDANAAYVKDISFVGRDCEVVVDLAPRMLEVIFPAAQRQDDSDIQEAYERALRCWTVWALLWRQLNDDIDVYDEEARNTRADVVQKLADEWLEAWVECVGHTQGLYIHMLHTHLSGWVRELGDLRLYQSQGLEHGHSIRKLIARLLCNRHRVVKKKRKDGGMGHARNEQMLSNVLARKELIRGSGHALHQTEHKRNEKAQRATQIKRVAIEAERGRVKVVHDF